MQPVPYLHHTLPVTITTYNRGRNGYGIGTYTRCGYCHIGEQEDNREEFSWDQLLEEEDEDDENSTSVTSQFTYSLFHLF